MKSPISTFARGISAACYYELLKIAEGTSVLLEEYAREMIVLEEMHLDEVNKMLRRPGATEPYEA
jgi:bacterioferritin